MKTSKRLLLGTFLALLAAPVALVAYSRITGGVRELPAPERTAPAELAALRDFTAVQINSDVQLELVGATTWSIEYTPIRPNRGNFTARVENGTLFIEGFGNRLGGPGEESASVRIGMPALERLESDFLVSAAIRNFDVDALYVRINIAGRIALENNRIGTLEMQYQNAPTVELRGNTIGSSEVRHFGTTTTTE
jgi:hypothetical protein